MGSTAKQQAVPSASSNVVLQSDCASAQISPAASSPDSSSSSSSAASSSLPHSHLLLHMDINGTVMPLDSHDTEPMRASINELISKHVFGHLHWHEDGSAHWVQDHSVWEHAHATEQHVTYHKWAKQHDGGRLLSHCFTDADQPGAAFADKFFEPLARYYPASDESAAADDDDARCGPLFPSFLRVLREYPEAKLVFRTFGMDALKAIGAVNRELRRLRMPTRAFRGYKLHRVPQEDATQLFRLEPLGPASPTADDAEEEQKEQEEEEEEVCGTAAMVGRFLASHARDLYVVDDYHYWKARDRAAAAGKPLFEAPPGYTVLGFDDNPCMQLPPHAPDMAPAHFVHVSPLRALLDEEYFVNSIERVLRHEKEERKQQSAQKSDT